jgi:FKBP-type peptidyl-prolyl cis-trans isomerase FkpA
MIGRYWQSVSEYLFQNANIDGGYFVMLGCRPMNKPIHGKERNMKQLITAVITTILVVPVFAAADDAIDKAAKEKGAVKTASGMVFKSIRDGKGKSPSASNTVEVNYRGTLTNGKEFDSSYKRNQSISFPLTGVIPCWTEGVQMMKVGGKARLVCPPELAYGSRGAGRDVPPNATLIFEVELLNIK